MGATEYKKVLYTIFTISLLTQFSITRKIRR